MRDDPIVEEVRRVGQQYIDSFDGNWQAIIADLDRRAREEGRQVVNPSPRPEGTAPIKSRRTAAKRAG